MKKLKTSKTYITISPRTHTAVSLKGEVNVKPLYLCTHRKRKVVVQQCKVVSAAEVVGTTRREEKRGTENGEYYVVFSFLLLSSHFLVTEYHKTRNISMFLHIRA